VDKREIAGILEEIAVLLEITGESPFKSRAYANAARTLQTLDRDLGALVAADELKAQKGIGPALAEKIAALAATGRLDYLDELRARVPPGLLDLLRVPGLGPKRVRELFEQLGVASLGELEYAAQTRALETLPGFGEKLQGKVLEGIAVLKRNAERFLLSDALAQGEEARARLAAHPAVESASLAGSLRRRCETVGNVDLVVATGAPAAALDAVAALAAVEEVTARGEADCAVRLAGGLRLHVRAVPPGELPFALRHFTGSKEHNAALVSRAAAAGLTLTERGLLRGGAPVPCTGEPELFAALGLADIPPELREDRGEIAAAERGELPRLLEEGDLQGILHAHSTYSDGLDTVREMALAARSRGYRYLGLTDHSQGARYANGLLPDAVKRQHEEIDRLNSELDGFRVLKGTECDILVDGRLDYPDEILSQFDFVVASVHSRFALGEAEMTERVLRALASPWVDILGHPTGRLLLAREPYAIRMAAVCEAAAERGVAVEINAHPSRLDLDWREAKSFLARGGWTSIDPDAHRVEGLDDVRYGVAIARKGWVPRERVLNALPLADLLARFAARRQGRAGRTEGGTP
jgi:DNA polymerase (family 10)